MFVEMRMLRVSFRSSILSDTIVTIDQLCQVLVDLALYNPDLPTTHARMVNNTEPGGGHNEDNDQAEDEMGLPGLYYLTHKHNDDCVKNNKKLY